MRKFKSMRSFILDFISGRNPALRSAGIAGNQLSRRRISISLSYARRHRKCGTQRVPGAAATAGRRSPAPAGWNSGAG